MRLRFTLTVLAIVGWELSATAAEGQEKRPNVLLIVNDDQGYGDASCYGATDVRTPHFDALAARGVRFTKFRVNPLCARSRVPDGPFALCDAKAVFAMQRGWAARSQRASPCWTRSWRASADRRVSARASGVIVVGIRAITPPVGPTRKNSAGWSTTPSWRRIGGAA